MTFLVITCDDCGEDVTFDRDKPIGEERLFCRCSGTTWSLTEARRAPAKVERRTFTSEGATMSIGSADDE